MKNKIFFTANLQWLGDKSHIISSLVATNNNKQLFAELFKFHLALEQMRLKFNILFNTLGYIEHEIRERGADTDESGGDILVFFQTDICLFNVPGKSTDT